MALSETGKWLQEALQKLSSDGESVQLDSETLYSLVSYCEMAPPADASEYLLNIVGDERCTEIVAEYIQRRGDTKSTPASLSTETNGAKSTPAGGLQAYQKPRQEEPWTAGTKKGSKQKAGAEASVNSDKKSPLLSGHGVLSAENVIQEGKRVGKGKRDKKEALKGLPAFTRHGPCTCQCRQHNLINNCLSCGRVVCEKEGEGPCNFCGALVLREGSDYAGLEGMQVPPATEAEIVAEEYKNRLVEYDRTSASRTTVIDDQGDYFQFEGDAWLSEKEKKLLEERLKEKERIEEERKKRVVVTIDLLGRKVVRVNQGDGEENGENFSILENEDFGARELPKTDRIKPNLVYGEIPKFVHTIQPNRTSFKARDFPIPSISGRIQHDDPVVEALIGRDLTTLGIRETSTLNAWQGPKAKADTREGEEESYECKADTSTSGRVPSNGTSSTLKEPAFDICLPKEKDNSKFTPLAPSLLMQKQIERKEALDETTSTLKQNKVLLPGMVLLKKWLTRDQQVDIVKYCHIVGAGPAGFYQPKYGDDAKMHLQMMCLGMQWEPTSKSYGPRRPHHDNAVAPSIPPSFTELVDKVLLAARVTASTQDSEGKTRRVKIDKNSLPDLVPNVCIVNFYEQSGKLGMHQDKDESAESLQKQLPVVSFSIGDSAEFIYGNDRDIENAQKLVLESGDVLIFGGLSRMIYHGITEVYPNTCPRFLVKATNLRPGRLNLTFRQN